MLINSATYRGFESGMYSWIPPIHSICNFMFVATQLRLKGPVCLTIIILVPHFFVVANFEFPPTKPRLKPHRRHNTMLCQWCEMQNTVLLPPFIRVWNAYIWMRALLLALYLRIDDLIYTHTILCTVLLCWCVCCSLQLWVRVQIIIIYHGRPNCGCVFRRRRAHALPFSPIYIYQSI